MKATSIAPPMSASAGGRPLANSVVAPVIGPTRNTAPARPSVTYNAPSGPIVLPDPQPVTHSLAAKLTSSRATGPGLGCMEVDASADMAGGTVRVRARTAPTPSLVVMLTDSSFGPCVRSDVDVGVAVEGDAGDVLPRFDRRIGLHERAGSDVPVQPREGVAGEVPAAAGGRHGEVDNAHGGPFDHEVGALVFLEQLVQLGVAVLLGRV